VQDNSERVKVRIEWIGAGTTSGIVIRPVGKLSDLSTYPQICQRVQELTEEGWAATAIAQALNDAGYCSAHATACFGAQTRRRDTTKVRSEGSTPAYQVSRWTFAQ
jgi:hypothetical protein